MQMARKSHICGNCENVNLPSACPACVNCGLNEKYKLLNVLQCDRDSLLKRLDAKLIAKRESDEQRHWRLIHAERIAQLKERLHLEENQLFQEKSKLEEKTKDLNNRKNLLDRASAELERNRTEQLKFYSDLICTQSLGLTAVRLVLLQNQSVVIKQLCKIFPLRRVRNEGENKDGSSSEYYDQICNVRLPRGLNPHTVAPEELAASLGYMVQLLNLVVRYLYAPLLLNSGFAASCSRVWQRASYWDARPASQSKEHPLFIPRQNYSTASEESSWSDNSSMDFGVASMESPRMPYLDRAGSSSFDYGSSSSHSSVVDKDLQKGIHLLKKSVACVTAYCFNSFSIPSPTELSTFEAFERMLTFMYSKDARAILSSKDAKLRSRRQMRQSNRTVHESSVADSGISSSSLEESKHANVEMKLGVRDGPSRMTSFLYTNEMSDMRRAENQFDGWDIVEHPTLPPPPSHSEDVEHWTRAMIIDAKRK